MDGVAKPAAESVRMAAVDAAMESQSDSKLKYVIMFGAPLVAGIALYWYINRRKKVADPGAGVGTSRVDVRASSQKKIEDQIASKDSKEKATGFKNKGNQLFRTNKFKEAIECYSEAIKVCPINETEMLSTFYQNRAAAYENLQMFDNVIQDCNKAIELNNKYSKAYFRRAKAWEQRGELRKCLEDTTFCSMVEQFTHRPALELADKMLKLFGAQQAKEIFAARQPSLPSSPFIRNFLRSFSEDPVMLDVHAKRNNLPQENDQGSPSGYDRALQDLIDENWDAVEGHCTEEIDKDQNKEKVDKALILRAGFGLIAGKVTEAMRDIDMLLARENVDIKVRVNALIKKATCELHCDQPDSSLATFQKAVDMDPNNADIFLHRGQVYLLLDQMDQTVKNFSIAASLKPDFVSPNVQLAYTEFRAGLRFNDVEQQNTGRKRFDECLKKFPTDSEVLFLYAQLMMGLEKFDFAEKYLNEFVKLDPLDSTGFVHLGILALQSKQDVPGAIALMQKAIETDPKCQLAYETLGTLYIQTGRFAEGVSLLERGIAMAQTEAEIAHLVGLKTTAEIQMSAAGRLGIELPNFPVAPPMN